jgi:predicted RNA-binding protein with PUA domain
LLKAECVKALLDAIKRDYKVMREVVETSVELADVEADEVDEYFNGAPVDEDMDD